MESNDLNSNSLNSEYGGNCIASHGSRRCLVSNNVQIYVDEGEAIKDAKASIESSLCHVLGPELRSNGRPVTCKELNVKLNAGDYNSNNCSGGEINESNSTRRNSMSNSNNSNKSNRKNSIRSSDNGSNESNSTTRNSMSNITSSRKQIKNKCVMGYYSQIRLNTIKQQSLFWPFRLFWGKR